MVSPFMFRSLGHAVPRKFQLKIIVVDGRSVATDQLAAKMPAVCRYDQKKRYRQRSALAVTRRRHGRPACRLL
jgi:hypothetical protein